MISDCASRFLKISFKWGSGRSTVMPSVSLRRHQAANPAAERVNEKPASPADERTGADTSGRKKRSVAVCCGASASGYTRWFSSGVPRHWPAVSASSTTSPPARVTVRLAGSQR